MDRRSLLLLTSVVAAAAAVTVAALLPAERVPGSPTPYCTTLLVFTDTDEAMREAERALRADPRVRELTARTKQENFAAFQESLGAEVVAGARPDKVPASLRVVESFGVDPRALRDDLERYGRATYEDYCRVMANLPR
ncbi:permease-like cell division protein FtsX [Saccharothrix coeruleofusca]|uniref:permease-like cell division protein FtsX n=1 Tax=Saccharothrix coeruleofusca TaxID=33919 RepID=UPI0016701963|nr:permease-like cell division protein FtsX [Saccharothrix coeruleofusca]